MRKQFFITLLEYILAIWIVLSYYSVYIENSFFGVDRKVYRIVGIVILLSINLLKKNLIANVLSLLVPIGLFSFVLSLYNYDSSFLFVIMMFMITLPLFIVFFQSKNNSFESILSFLYKLSNVIMTIGFFSLVLWFFVSILGILKPNIIIPDTWDPYTLYIKSYNMVYFETQVTNDLFSGIPRNTGVFEEAPVFNLLLCLALGIELFLSDKVSYPKVICLSIIILSTFTTTGIIFLLFSWFIYFTKFVNVNSRFILGFKLLIPIVLIVLYLIIGGVMSVKQESSSFQSRYSHILLMIDAFLSNPLFGIGINNYKGPISNSLFHLLSEGGLFLFLFYIFIMFINPLKMYLKKIDYKFFCFSITYLFAFVFTIGYFETINIMFLAYCLSYYNMLKYNHFKSSNLNSIK